MGHKENMNKKRKGILLTSDFELAINPVRHLNGLIISGLVIGECIDQEALIVLKSKPGEIKEDPILGPGLTKFIRGKHNQSEIENVINLHFTRVGIDFEDYKDRLQTTIQ